jgi:hypothetical protein
MFEGGRTSARPSYRKQLSNINEQMMPGNHGELRDIDSAKVELRKYLNPSKDWSRMANTVSHARLLCGCRFVIRNADFAKRPSVEFWTRINKDHV